MHNIISLHTHRLARAKAAAAIVQHQARDHGLSAAAVADESQRARVQVISGASVARAVADAKRRINQEIGSEGAA